MNAKQIALCALLCLCAAGGFAQKRESLALLPFTGGEERDGEYIAGELTRQKVLRDAFNRVIPVTKTTQAFIAFEQRFQRDSWLTDADTIFELGKQLNADFVIAGYITRFGDKNLVLVSILDVESLQQVAGDYRTYQTIEEIDKLIPDIAGKLADGAMRNTANLTGLSVPPFEISTESDDANDAQVLAQILATEIANGNKYAVLPRTDSLEKVLEEHNRERSGETDQARVNRLGAGRNARYVLAGSVGKLGTLKKFATDVLDIEDGRFVDGYSEPYNTFAEGFDLMPNLAAQLNRDESYEAEQRRKLEEAAAAAKRDADRIAGGEARRRWLAKIDDFFHEENRFWSLGISAGTSLTAPWLIAAGTVTASFLPYTILEAGFDAGIIHGYGGAEAEQVSYYSLYPFGHIGFFLPIGDRYDDVSLRWYLGAGGGFMMAHYGDTTLNAAAFDAATSIFLGQGHHYASLSYTLRSPMADSIFRVLNHKISVGYSYRF
jgi:TolB-like protein